MKLQIRHNENTPRIYWIASDEGDDVAYITKPGTGYFVWPIIDKWKGRPTRFVDQSFSSIEDAFSAVAFELDR